MATQKKRKLSERAQAIRSYNEWVKDNRKLDELGMHGTDYYVNKVSVLEEKIKKLEAQLRKAKK